MTCRRRLPIPVPPARHETVASYLARLANLHGLDPGELWQQASTPQPGTRRRVINPKLVEEQARGGIVQGIGGALYEHCLYDERGQLLNATMADYLVPMAAEMPDIECAHVETPTKTSMLGAKGAGEAGTGGAPAAIMNAVNDALRPLGAKVASQPITPEMVLRALGKVN